MATYTEIGNRVRAQIRRKGFRPQTETFPSRALAVKWATAIEADMNRGTFTDASLLEKMTVAQMIDDYRTLRKRPLGKSHGNTLNMMKRSIGKETLAAMTVQRFVRYAQERTCSGATWSQELSYMSTMMKVAKIMWHMPINGDPPREARIPLGMLGYSTKAKERSRRPTDDELDRLCLYFTSARRRRGSTPIDILIQFAIATAMRVSEICRITWADLDPITRTVWIRDRKDPRQKAGNDMEVPLLPDAWKLIQAMPRTESRIFPFDSASVSSVFARGCKELGIVDLHFHDFRHEGTTRLFMMGYKIEEVAIFTGHKEWEMLKRYTHIKPSSLHRGDYVIEPGSVPRVPNAGRDLLQVRRP